MARLHRAGWLLAVLSAGCLAGFLSVAVNTHVPTPGSVDAYADGATHTLRGRVVLPPVLKDGKMRYTVETEAVTATGGAKRVTGRVLVTDAAAWPRLRYGDVLEARGPLEQPGVIEDFHYDRYLAISRIYAVMYRGFVTPLHLHGANPIMEGLYALRDGMEAHIAELYPEPQGSLLAGLLVGSQTGMPADVADAFRRAGLTHLVAISGANITMLLACAAPFLRRFKAGWRLIPSLLLVTAFAILTGGSASVTRAAIMGAMALVAGETGRRRDIHLAMLWTAGIMAAWNPSTLWDDAGFHLSFLALLGLVELSPVVAPLLTWVPETLGLRESLCSTLAAQLATGPWGMHLFGSVSLVAPVANLLAPPAVPYARRAPSDRHHGDAPGGAVHRARPAHQT